jgi:hypothetical protein
MLPHDVDAEEQVIAYALTDPIGKGDLLAALRPEEFANPARGDLWRVMQGLASEHGPSAVDEVLVRDRVRQLKALSAVETRHVLDHVAGTVTTNLPPDPIGTARLEKAATVKRLARQRAGIEVLLKGFAPLYQRDCNPVDIVVELDAVLRGLVSDWQSDGMPPHQQKQPDLFPLLTDLEAEQLKPQQGILGDILYEDSLAFLYGRSGWWKSFVALSWALSIAAGVDWLGKRVIAGDVVYVTAEGARGVGKRITAWKQRHGLEGQSVRLHVLGVPVHLLRPEEVGRLIRSIQAKSSQPVLVVIDTLDRSMAGGNENDTQDASALIAAADAVRTEFGCCVLFIHHVGVADMSRQRGSSVFRGAADTEIRVAAIGPGAQKDTLEPGDVIQVTCQKPKENEPFTPLSLTTERETWATGDGEILGSLVIIAAEKSAEVKARVKPADLRGNRKTAYDALAELCASPAGGGTYAEWQAASKLVESSFKEARKKLIEWDLVRQNERAQYYVHVEPDIPPGPKGQESAKSGPVGPDETDEADEETGPIGPTDAGPGGEQENTGAAAGPKDQHSLYASVPLALPNEALDGQNWKQTTEQGQRTNDTVESIGPLALDTDEPRCVVCGSIELDRFDAHGSAFCADHWTLPETPEDMATTTDSEVQ